MKLYTQTLSIILLLLFNISVANSEQGRYELTYSLAGKNAYHHIVFTGEPDVDTGSYQVFLRHLKGPNSKIDHVCDIRLAITLAEMQRRTKEHIILHSGYRSEEQNKKANGVPLSHHLNCSAVDIQILGYTAKQSAVIAVAVLNDLWGQEVGGIGVNTTTIHIDTGARRFWQKSH